MLLPGVLLMAGYGVLVFYPALAAVACHITFGHDHGHDDGGQDGSVIGDLR